MDETKHWKEDVIFLTFGRYNFFLLYFLENSFTATVFFYQYTQESQDLAEAIRKPKRTNPFLLKIGQAFHIVADGVTIIRAKNSRDGLLCLFCVQYAFHILYNPKVEPAFLFIQSRILKKEDSFTRSSKTLSIFLKQLAVLESDSEDSMRE